MPAEPVRGKKVAGRPIVRASGFNVLVFNFEERVQPGFCAADSSEDMEDSAGLWKELEETSVAQVVVDRKSSERRKAA